MADEDDKSTDDERDEDEAGEEAPEGEAGAGAGSGEDEPAADADAEPAAAAGDARDADEGEAAEIVEAPKKKKKKSKKSKAEKSAAPAKGSTAPKSAAPAKAAPKPAREAGDAPAAKAPEAEREDGSTMIALGAFVVAILAVAGLWYYNKQNTDDEAAEDVEDPAGDEAATAADPTGPPDDPADPHAGLPAMPEAPGAIPAPPDVAAPPADAERTESGLASKVLTAGTGDAHPAATDRVTVHYTGWTTDGRMFDSSRRRDEPATFALNQVIAGWTEGVQLMVVGESRRFWIPQELAYRGQPGMPAGMLVFDVELLSFETPPPPPPTPEDVAAVPANATTTESGLAYRVLQPGTGTEHPQANAVVRVHYSGWTTDGQMFDSSIVRGQPAMLMLGRVIPGWTEALQLMVVGEKRRLWIPESLAYRGRPGAPPGMLVFDVELLEILRTPSMPGLPPGHP